MNLRGDLFLKLYTAKIGVTEMPKRTEHLWVINMLKAPKQCLNHHGSSFVIFFDKFKKKISSKNSFLVVFEIL